jgi:ABC-type nitrate/sulfonate/bicarbonate transport system substrate-binding protein
LSSNVGFPKRSRRYPRSRVRLLGLTATAACVAAATACGSSGSSATAASTSRPSSASSASSGTTTNITLAFPLYGAGDVPFFLAQDKGYFKQEGLNVKFTVVTASVGLQAASSGSIQLDYTTTIRPVKTLSQGERFYAFMPVNVGFTDDVIMSKAAYQAAGLSSSSTLKQMMTALIHKPLGIISAGGENQEVWDYLFHLAGLPESDVDTVALGSPDANLAALKRGSVVASNLGGTSPAQAVQDGYAVYLTRLSENSVPSMNQVVSDMVVASSAYAQANPSVLTGFVAAYNKAVADTYADPAAAEATVYKDYPSEFASESQSDFDAELNLLLSTKQLDTSPTLTATQISTLGTFFDSTGQSIPSNWQEVFQKP